MSGPPPKDASVRRRKNPTRGFKLLPHEGRTAPAPDWPLPVPNPSPQLWAKLWSLPQAVEWERVRCEEMIALYVLTFDAASRSGDSTKLLAETRQLDANIGLSPKAMRGLWWETDEPAPEEENGSGEEKPKEERVYVPRKPGGEE